jgi:ELWxxDGT repeat protein
MRKILILTLLSIFFSCGSIAQSPELVKKITTYSQVAPIFLTNVNGTLFFVAEDGINGWELWKSDGTTAGTYMVKDITAGSASSDFKDLINMNGMLFFTVDDGVHGYELWKSDGTANGTVMVKDILVGSGSSMPLYLTVVNGILYFSAIDTSTGQELWRSDGTTNGTVLVQDIRLGTSGSNPSKLTEVNGQLFFVANNGFTTGYNGSELWVLGNAQGYPQITRDIVVGPGSSNPSKLTNVNGILYFTANNGLSGVELFASDGSNQGTVLVKDIVAGTGSSNPDNLINVNGTLFFTADDGTHNMELWKSLGVTNAILVKDIRQGTQASIPNYLVNVNGILYFSAYENSTGEELWKSDGTESGTSIVKDIYPGDYVGNPYNSYPHYLINGNGELYFTADDGVYSRYRLWKSDGTTNGTVKLNDIESFRPTIVNRTIFFLSVLTSGWELWKITSSICTPPTAPVITSNIANNSLCIGSQASVTATGCSGTVNWSTGATTSSITVNPTVNTTYTATCTDVCGVSPSGSFPITVNPLPTIPSISQTGTKILCPRVSFSLSASGCNGSTITWSNNTVGSSISVNSANTYTATCTNVCGTSTASSPLIVLEAANTQTLSGIASAGLSHASQSLSSTQTVNNGLNVAYQAGNDITLNTDFISDFGSTFNAEIGSACPITDGLVAFYNLDNNFTDLSGNGHNATYASAILTTGRKGIASTAYSFNGINHRINLGGWFNYQEFTLSMWLNAATTQNNSYAMIIDNNHGSNISFNVQQDYTINNRYYFAVGGNPTHGYSPFSLTPNQWEHIVMVKGNGFMKVFKNGVLLGSVTHSGAINYTGTVPSLCLGAYVNNGNYIRYWAGKMDDIKIYNRALSDVEVGYLSVE